MRKQLAVVTALGVVIGAAVGFAAHEGKAEAKKGTQLAHDVYFALKDSTPAARAKLVEQCQKYLTKHPGAVAFSVGTLADDLNAPVNDRDFDVALHVVFQDKAAHDSYQVSERHKEFVAEIKDGIKKVRVFDSHVAP